MRSNQLDITVFLAETRVIVQRMKELGLGITDVCEAIRLPEAHFRSWLIRDSYFVDKQFTDPLSALLRMSVPELTERAQRPWYSVLRGPPVPGLDEPGNEAPPVRKRAPKAMAPVVRANRRNGSGKALTEVRRLKTLKSRPTELVSAIYAGALDRAEADLLNG